MFEVVRRPRLRLGVCVLGILVAGACGDDDGEPEAEPTGDSAVAATETSVSTAGATDEVCAYGFELSEAISSEAFDSEAEGGLQVAYETMIDVTTRGAELTQGSVAADLAALTEGLTSVNAILAEVDYDFNAVDRSVFDEFGALAVPSSRIERYFAAQCGIDIVPDDYNGAEIDEGGYVTLPVGRVSELAAGSAAPGPDDALDALWTACAEGDLASCDQLFTAAPRDTTYSTFGATCGAVDSVSRFGQCSVDPGAAAEFGDGGLAAYDPTVPLSPDDPAPGPDPQFDELWTACSAGDPQACNNLYLSTPVGSVYEAFGATCGGRQLDVVGGGNCS